MLSLAFKEAETNILGLVDQRSKSWPSGVPSGLLPVAVTKHFEQKQPKGRKSLLQLSGLTVHP